MDPIRISAMGVGPINDRLCRFCQFTKSCGRHVTFGRDKNVAAIKKLLEWLQEANFITAEIVRNIKCNKQSKMLRTKGNKLFTSDTDLSKALDLYNQSICWAEDTGEELAIGFANRSAVYFEWEKYDACLENIDLAVKAGCPERLMDKLNQRKANCVTNMNAIKVGINANDPMSKIHSIDKLCLKMKDFNRLKSKHFCFDIDETHCEPQLSLPANPKIPFIANCLEMKTSPQKGRYIVTTKELKPGQIISIEDPFLASLEKEHRYRKCANCFAENFMNLIPCKACTCTMFCSQKCLTESETGFHQYECSIADYIWNNFHEIGLTFRLAVKAFTMFDTVQELVDFREHSKTANATVFSFDHTIGLDDRDRYSQIENLCTNEENRIEDDLFTRGCKIALLYHHLIEKTKFGEMLRTDAERDVLISLLFHHSQTTSINSINCYEYDDVNLEAMADFKSSDVFARGMYPFSSLYNHSCAPNMATVAVGTKIVSYVTRDINKNSEVLLCLKRTNHFQRKKDERQHILKLVYGFTCKCEACQKNYPSIYEEHLAFGFLNAEIKAVVDAITFNLNEDVEMINRFSALLSTLNKHYPTGALYDIAGKMHRALVLKHGNLASQLQITMKKNQAKYSAALQK
ncbi:SET and MYND domain-containing protein 4-like [Bradysia coprophila]|uniref:SET and MYND domain-containing protein 4-like n=1 Tax=Bradysia coprophila TaxID=38358 RepID=UPI00187DAC71|nr:SET and MYND domain-containing protein 4-like [Bradysia coprophila]